MGPFTVTSRMQLRAVAVSGHKRSQAVAGTVGPRHRWFPNDVMNYHSFGQIIATSHDRWDPPNGGDCKRNPRLFQGNLGW